MKLFHLSDLHIGKQLKGYSLLENQEHVLEQVIAYAGREHPDAILLCGDIYDKAVPSGEAYQLLDRFLTGISYIQPCIPILMIAGNHDSPHRLSYAGTFLERNQIYISVFPPRSQDENLKKVVLQDAYGPVNFYLMPFVKPGYLRWMQDKNEIRSYEDAVRALLRREEIRKEERNIILSHQFYIGGQEEPQICDSEEAVFLAGGLDQIPASVLMDFDYAALGHLHGAQKVESQNMRYCGTPYKYSVSEEHHRKSVTVVEMGAKGEDIKLRFLPLQGIQDVRTMRGTLENIIHDVTEKSRHDFVSVTVTEEEIPYRMREQLLEVLDHLLEIKIENQRMGKEWEDWKGEEVITSPMDAFRQFYETVRLVPMSSEEILIIEEILQEIKEDTDQ